MGMVTDGNLFPLSRSTCLIQFLKIQKTNATQLDRVSVQQPIQESKQHCKTTDSVLERKKFLNLFWRLQNKLFSILLEKISFF